MTWTRLSGVVRCLSYLPFKLSCVRLLSSKQSRPTPVRLTDGRHGNGLLSDKNCPRHFVNVASFIRPVLTGHPASREMAFIHTPHFLSTLVSNQSNTCTPPNGRARILSHRAQWPLRLALHRISTASISASAASSKSSANYNKIGSSSSSSSSNIRINKSTNIDGGGSNGNGGGRGGSENGGGGGHHDEDERLQNDRRYVMREFGKVAFVASLIGLVLFCFDIVISLVALTIGSVYALAVLFDIQFITNRVGRIRSMLTNVTYSTFKTARTKWDSLRSRIYDLFSRS